MEGVLSLEFRVSGLPDLALAKEGYGFRRKNIKITNTRIFIFLLSLFRKVIWPTAVISSH